MGAWFVLWPVKYYYSQTFCKSVLFDPNIEVNQVLPLQFREDMRVMIIKEDSTFTKTPRPHHQM